MSNNIQDIIQRQTSGMIMPPSPMTYSQILNLLLNTPLSWDLKTLANIHRIQFVQGIWIDNSLGTAPLSVFVPGTFQNFSVPAGYQGVAPLFLDANQVLTFTGVNANANVILCNFPVPVGVWQASTGTGQQTFTGGNLNVTDPALDAKIEAGGLGVMTKSLGPGDVPFHTRAGQSFSGLIQAAGTVTIIAGAPSAFISGIDLWIDPITAAAAAGSEILIQVGFSTAGLVLSRTALTTVTGYGNVGVLLASISNLDLVGNLGGDNVTITNNITFTAGGFRYTIWGGTTGVD